MTSHSVAASAPLFLLCVSLIAQEQPKSAHVSGIVLDGNGAPLVDAQVDFFPLEAALSGPQRLVKSDEHGHYFLSLPPMGRVELFAEKDSAGYPDTMFAVFASGKERDTVVNLTPGAELTGVDILLGKPDGMVTIHVTDSVTGRVVQGARITMRRNDDPTAMYATDIATGTFVAPLPHRPLTIAITAARYRPWTYVNAVTGKPYIDLDEVSRETVEAALIPVNPAP